MSTAFKLDTRLQRDTLFFRHDEGLDILLMNDSRWPWFILVPHIEEATMIEDIPSDMAAKLLEHSANISRALKIVGHTEKTNIGSLGNIVSQFHWHVVGRHRNDPNWPHPVWGYGEAVPYSQPEAQAFLEAFDVVLKTVISSQ